MLEAISDTGDIKITDAKVIVGFLGGLKEEIVQDVRSVVLGLHLEISLQVVEFLLLGLVLVLKSVLVVLELSLVLGLEKLLLFFLLLDLDINLLLLVFLLELNGFDVGLEGKLLLLEDLLGLDLSSLLLDLQFLLEDFTFLLQFLDVVFVVNHNLLGTGFLLNLVLSGISLEFFLGDLLVDVGGDSLGVLATGFSELGLEVLEERRRHNSDILDLNSFEPHSPSGQKLLDFFFDTVSELVSVFQNFIKAHVGNSVSDDGGGHRSQLLVSLFWVRAQELFTEVLVALERTITLSVDAPDNHSFDLNSLHLGGYLRSAEVNLVNLTGEDHSLVAWHDPGLEADTALDHLTISDHEHPLVGLGLLPQSLGIVEPSVSRNSEHNEEHNHWRVVNEFDKGPDSEVEGLVAVGHS